MNKFTLQQLALLAIEGKIETLRFGSDGRTAVIKYYVGANSDRMLVEKRIIPTKDESGTDIYDISFLSSLTSI